MWRNRRVEPRREREGRGSGSYVTGCPGLPERKCQMSNRHGFRGRFIVRQCGDDECRGLEPWRKRIEACSKGGVCETYYMDHDIGIRFPRGGRRTQIGSPRSLLTSSSLLFSHSLLVTYLPSYIQTYIHAIAEDNLSHFALLSQPAPRSHFRRTSVTSNHPRSLLPHHI